jgi:hypothetical protein
MREVAQLASQVATAALATNCLMHLFELPKVCVGNLGHTAWWQRWRCVMAPAPQAACP